jgi:hypothetical protein
MVVTLSGIVTEVRPESRKALPAMVTRPDWRVTFVREVVPVNELSDSVATSGGMITDVRAVLPANAAVPIVVTPVP